MISAASLSLLLLTITAEVAIGFRLVVLHTNDMHARIEEVAARTGPCRKNGGEARCYGGFARLAAAVKSIREKEPNNTIFLNAGDNFQGTPYYYVFKWNIIAEFIDKLGIDVMSLGNHEFDDGVEGLEPYLKTVKTPSVAANLDLSRYPQLLRTNLHPTYNLMVSGVNISVIGYITPETKSISRPGLVKFTEEIPVIRKLAREARAAGAKIVIALGHSGFPMDKKIAAEVADVDVVVGGHTDTFLYTGSPPDLEVPESTYPHIVEQESGKKVPVVQAYGYTKYLGYLELEFDNNYKLIKSSGNPILLDSSMPQDVKILADVTKWKNNMSATLGEVIGRTVVDLDGYCRNGECNMGNFFTDAIVDYYVRFVEGQMYDSGWTKAPIAIMNGGAIRASLSLNETQGNIDEADILTVVPFDNKMVRVTVNGDTLKGILETSVNGYHMDGQKGKGGGGFLQFSGMKVKYDVSRPKGDRVVSVLVRCGFCMVPEFQPLDPKANYSLVVSEYLIQGGDGFTILKKIPLEDQEKLDWREIEAIKSYCTKSTPFYPGLERRIQFVSHRESGDSSSVATLLHPHTITILSIAFLLSLLVAL